MNIYLSIYLSIGLRPYQLSDAKTSWRWRLDRDLWKWTTKHPYECEFSEATETAWAKNVLTTPTRRLFAVCHTSSHRHIGNLYLSKLKETESAEIGLVIGERSEWGKGYGAAAISAFKIIAKEIYGLRTLTMEIAAENIASQKMFMKCGAYRVGGDTPWTTWQIDL